jgi:hypothetical protein
VSHETPSRACDSENRTTLAEQWRPQLIASDGWDPFAFVDLCEQSARSNAPLHQAARQIQWREMLRLLEHTLADAVG